jgi:hypothetical protein
MSNSNKSKGYLVVILVVIIAILIFILVAAGHSDNNSYKTYDSLELLKKNIDMDIEIPDAVSSQSDLDIRSIMGEIVEISNNDIEFKAMYFVDNNADPLGIYDEYEVDNKYIVNSDETEINYFRYRTDSSQTTLINWCTSEIAYGLTINKQIAEPEALEMIDLTSTKLEPINTEKDVEEVINYEYEEYLVGDNIKLKLPILNSDIKQIDLDGYTIFYLDKKIVFVVLYNDYDIDTNAFDNQSEIELDNGIVLKYLTENPFDSDSTAYSDYEIFIDAIDDISKSVEYN